MVVLAVIGKFLRGRLFWLFSPQYSRFIAHNHILMYLQVKAAPTANVFTFNKDIASTHLRKNGIDGVYAWKHRSELPGF